MWAPNNDILPRGVYICHGRFGGVKAYTAQFSRGHSICLLDTLTTNTAQKKNASKLTTDKRDKQFIFAWSAKPLLCISHIYSANPFIVYATREYGAQHINVRGRLCDTMDCMSDRSKSFWRGLWDCVRQYLYSWSRAWSPLALRRRVYVNYFARPRWSSCVVTIIAPKCTLFL